LNGVIETQGIVLAVSDLTSPGRERMQKKSSFIALCGLEEGFVETQPIH